MISEGQFCMDCMNYDLCDLRKFVELHGKPKTPRGLEKIANVCGRFQSSVTKAIKDGW